MEILVVNIVNHSAASVHWRVLETSIKQGRVIPNVPSTPTASLQSLRDAVHIDMAPIGKLYGSPLQAQIVAVGRHHVDTL